MVSACHRLIAACPPRAGRSRLTRAPVLGPWWHGGGGFGTRDLIGPGVWRSLSASVSRSGDAERPFFQHRVLRRDHGAHRVLPPARSVRVRVRIRRRKGAPCPRTMPPRSVCSVTSPSNSVLKKRLFHPAGQADGSTGSSTPAPSPPVRHGARGGRQAWTRRDSSGPRAGASCLSRRDRGQSPPARGRLNMSRHGG